ncbi:TolC family protein [uncultured Eudoraea sp.]|uniref:TolC family protein n=1 Tax=uncultured Eudoraea sp. TaxID=1035614 RepID=UPI00261736EA|nr:TolC family protein [uncultured Eudoraea sp.]
MRKIVLIYLLVIPFIVLSQEKKTYNIGILVDLIKPELIPTLEDLKNEITDVVGEDAYIQFPDEYFLSNDLDLQRARTNYEQLLNSDTDIILAFGLVNNAVMIAQDSFPKPTIIFGAVNNDFLDIDKEVQTSGIENITYLISSRSYINDLATFYELTGFKKLGIVVQQPFMEVYPYEDLFDEEIQKYGAEYKLISFNTYEDITANLQDIDALYLAETFYLTSEEISGLAELCIQLGLPSFSSTKIEDVRLGILATNEAKENLYQFFRRIALSVEAYIQGGALAELPVYISFDEKLTINYNTADRIALPIKYSLVAITDFIGSFDKKISEEKYNLLEVINRVLANNLQLQTLQKDVELSEKEVQSAWTSYIPSVSASATGTYIDPQLAEASQGINPEYSTDASIVLNQTVFSADANAGINIQKDLLGSQRERFYADQLDAIFEASNAYFNALILKQNLQIRATNLNLTKKNVEIASENFEAGLAGKSDLLRFRSELAQDMQAMIEAINELDQGFFELNQILNNPIDYNIDVEEAELEEGLFEQYNYTQLRELLDDPKLRRPFVSFLVEEAKRNAPELKALDYDISAIGRSVRLNTSGRFLPDLAIQGQFNQNFNRWGVGVNPNFDLDNNYTVGVNLSIPIVDQNRQNINRQIALIQKDQLDLSKSNTNLAIETNVNTAVINLINEVANISLSKVAEAAAEEALDLTQTSYSNGAVNIVQLLDAQNNYLNARVARANATYTYLLASLRLERFVGYYFLLHSTAENDEFIRRFYQFLEQNNN